MVSNDAGFHSRIELSRAAFANNVRFFRGIIPKSVDLVAVVKANAYGHGLKQTVTALDQLVDAYQVDDVQELVALRSDSQKMTYLLGYTDPTELEVVVHQGAVVTLLDITHAKALAAAAVGIGLTPNNTIKVSLAIDLRFGREGTLVSEAREFIQVVNEISVFTIESIYGHFSAAEDTNNQEFDTQSAAFLELVREYAPHIRSHIANTAGLLRSDTHDYHHHAVRVGLGVYGLWPAPQDSATATKVTPALRWISRVAQVKTLPAGYPIGYNNSYWTKSPTKVALVPQGYSDGLDRRQSNNGAVLIGGAVCPILGKVSMNMITVDISKVASVNRGDEVVLIGNQGNSHRTANDIAADIGTISYEVLAKLSPLLPRSLTL